MRFTAATYNIHRCVGRDRAYSPDRTRAVLAELDADIIAVQEFDNRARHGRPELTPEDLSAPLGMTCLAQTTMVDPNGGCQANLLLSRHPVDTQEHVDLGRSGLEIRRAILARIETASGPVVAVSTHLGLSAIGRRRQARALVGAIARFAESLPVVILGDFNQWLPFGGCHTVLARRFAGGDHHRTFPIWAPVLPLDRVWVGGGLEIDHVAVHRSQASHMASDHLPLVANVSAPSSARAAASRNTSPGRDETSTISP